MMHPTAGVRIIISLLNISSHAGCEINLKEALFIVFRNINELILYNIINYINMIIIFVFFVGFQNRPFTKKRNANHDLV